MKICSKCNKEKLLIEFGEDKRNKDGYKGVCKFCVKTYKHNYDKENNLQNKAYYNINKEKINRQNKNNYYKNKKHFLEKVKEYRTKNRDYYIKYFKNYNTKKRKMEIEQKLTKSNGEGTHVLYGLLFTRKSDGYQFLKIGETSRTIQERFRNYKNYKYIVLFEILTSIEKALSLEADILLNYNTVGIDFKDEKFSGYTECFEIKSEIYYEGNFRCLTNY